MFISKNLFKNIETTIGPIAALVLHIHIVYDTQCVLHIQRSIERFFKVRFCCTNKNYIIILFERN